MSDASDRSRRDFLRLLAALPLAGTAAGASPPPSRSAPTAPKGTGRAVVARGRRAAMCDADERVDDAKMIDALGAAVARAAGEGTPVAAMRRLLRPRDVVGLKVNCLAGRGLSPHPALVRGLCDWIAQAGVPAHQIVVFDRSDRELRGAGFTLNRAPTGVRILGVNNDYDWTPREWGPGGSCFARLLVNELTALINVGILKDHDLAGISGTLKNWYGVIHNPNKHHDDGCAPYIPHLAAYPLIRDKVRLAIFDAVAPQCHGGPARNPKWIWPYGAVLASTDPVAIDAIGWRILEERRRKIGLPTLEQEKRAPRWIAGAAKIGLGVADPARIAIEEV